MSKREIPDTPSCLVELKTRSGVPSAIVQADDSNQIIAVDVFFTRHGQIDGERNNRDNTVAKFWHHAKCEQQGKCWNADLPLFGTEQPLWVYANVTYALDAPITGAGYYYRTYSAGQFVLSSLMAQLTPKQLDEAGVRSTLEPTMLIEDFQGDWEKEWFTYRPDEWAITTHKVYDAVYAAPENARLSIEVQSGVPNDLVILIDDHAAIAKLDGGTDFQNVSLSLDDFEDYAGVPLATWKDMMSLKLSPAERLKPGRRESGKPRMIGQPWKGSAPKFRNLRWTKENDEPNR
jgi:hypothetical protein